MVTKFSDRRVLLLYSATGQGHRSVALAIHDSIEINSGANSEAIEVFAALRPRLIGGWPAAYSWMSTRFIGLYNMLFFLTDTYYISAIISKMIYVLSRGNINQILKRKNPDIVVATAPFIAQVVAQARRELKADFRIINVVSDLVTPHASWVCKNADLTVTFSPLAQGRLMRAGAGGRILVQAQFPVQKSFTMGARSKMQCRRDLGVSPDHFTVLLSGGSLGAGPMLYSAMALYEKLPDVQLLIVAGCNDHLYRTLRSQFNDERARVYAFTAQMPTLVRASDVVVSKGGPSSIMESNAAGRPIVIIDEVGAQERGNGAWAQHLGIGFHARSTSELIAIIESLRCNSSNWEARVRESASKDTLNIGALILEF